jgi:ABC-2 type transport system permease protein
VSAFRAELLKARTTRLLLWYGVGLAAFLTLVVSIHVGTGQRFDLAEASSQRSLFAAAGLAAVLAVLIGTVLLGSEYNHGTINQSFLAVPNRLELLAAKLGAAALIGAGIGLLSDALMLVLSALWYGGRGLTLHFGDGIATPLLGALAASVLAAAVGIGVAAILRRQTASIVVVLLWLLIGENIVAISPRSVRYAPGHVFGAIVAAHRQGTSDTLGVWPAVLLGGVYVVILFVIGALVVLGSDAPSSGD